MTTRYRFFESGTGLIAVKLGIVPLSLLAKYDFYKTYLEFKEQGTENPILLASDRCGCHISSIYRAIYWFERDDPHSSAHLQIVENKKVA